MSNDYLIRVVDPDQPYLPICERLIQELNDTLPEGQPTLSILIEHADHAGEPLFPATAVKMRALVAEQLTPSGVRLVVYHERDCVKALHASDLRASLRCTCHAPRVVMVRPEGSA